MLSYVLLMFNLCFDEAHEANLLYVYIAVGNKNQVDFEVVSSIKYHSCPTTEDLRYSASRGGPAPQASPLLQGSARHGAATSSGFPQRKNTNA